MRKTILTIMLIIGMVTTIFGQLSTNAKILKEGEPQLYQNIKVLVEKKWKGDHEMMVYTINSQVEAVLKWAKLINAPNYDKDLMLRVATNWSEKINGEIIFDYEMIVYEYNNQMKAKNSY